MWNKLSLKIGLLFFVFFLIIEAVLFVTLYVTLANDRVEEVLDNLLARGEMHGEVLEDSFEQTTLDHVGMMESASEFSVIITDASGNVLVHSDPIEPEMEKVLEHTDFDAMLTEGKVIERNWENHRFISTDSPITIDGNHQGHVFMFAKTESIQHILEHLKNLFLWIGMITVLLTVITILLLSRFITLPLIRMKKATEQLSKGYNKVDVMMNRNDELGELAYSINKLSTDLDRLKTARNEFLGSISHELRTPLTYIKGYADILGRSDTTEQEKEEYIGIIQEESAHLTALIQSLFELAKMDRHQFPINREEVMVKELLHSVASLVKPAFEAEHIELSVNCSIEDTVLIDPERIQQVLLNILDNARKYSAEGSKVRLECRLTEQQVEIRVEDEGEGIPEAELPFVFERLYRVEKSRSRKGGGAGLGLAIAKEIVESHGGHIGIRSEGGKGTVVIVQLERGDPHSKSAASG